MTAEEKAGHPTDGVKTDTPKGETWKPVAGSEQDTHMHTPGGGQDSKHGRKDSGADETAHAATRKGKDG